MSNLLSIFRRVDSALEEQKPRSMSAKELGVPETLPPPAALRHSPAADKPVPARPAAQTNDVARLVLAVDATLSRSAAWKASQRVMAALFEALPGELLVALAVHGGGKVHTFTKFLPDVRALMRQAGRIECKAGPTALLDIFERVLKAEPVRVIVYVGDVFEESIRDANRLAEELAARETSVIILHDRAQLFAPQARTADAVFQRIAAITGGAVLPSDASALDELRAMLAAVAVLAVGGEEMLEAQQEAMPAVPVLLERLAESKQLLIGSTKR